MWMAYLCVSEIVLRGHHSIQIWEPRVVPIGYDTLSILRGEPKRNFYLVCGLRNNPLISIFRFIQKQHKISKTSMAFVTNELLVKPVDL